MYHNMLHLGKRPLNVIMYIANAVTCDEENDKVWKCGSAYRELDEKWCWRASPAPLFIRFNDSWAHYA